MLTASIITMIINANQPCYCLQHASMLMYDQSTLDHARMIAAGFTPWLIPPLLNPINSPFLQQAIPAVRRFLAGPKPFRTTTYTGRPLGGRHNAQDVKPVAQVPTHGTPRQSQRPRHIPHPHHDPCGGHGCCHAPASPADPHTPPAAAAAETHTPQTQHPRHRPLPQ